MRNSLAVAVVLSSFGCSKAAVEQVATYEACGYHIELRSADYRDRSIESRCTGSGDARTDDVTVKLDARTLRIVNGALSLDGRERGTVEPGDKILLHGDGTLTVNGAAR